MTYRLSLCDLRLSSARPFLAFLKVEGESSLPFFISLSLCRLRPASAATGNGLAGFSAASDLRECFPSFSRAASGGEEMGGSSSFPFSSAGRHENEKWWWWCGDGGSRRRRWRWSEAENRRAADGGGCGTAGSKSCRARWGEGEVLSPLFPPVVSVLPELTTEETDRQPVCYALGGKKIFLWGESAGSGGRRRAWIATGQHPPRAF